MPSFNNPKVTNPINSDVSEIRELLKIVAKQDYTGATDLPEGAKRLAAVSGGVQLQKYANSSWTSIGKLMHSVDQLDGFHASTSAVKNTIPVYNAAAQLVGSITGNAATATKLASARTIDIGGIASADAVAFDGTKGITIPINSINVANEADNALVGIVSKAHGGTGRNDGAASDVILANGGKASDYGQIGDAKSIEGKDLNSIVNSGVYMGTKATIANHFPRGTSVGFLLYVAKLGTNIRQTLIMRDTEVWHRRSNDSGASWETWHSIGYSCNDNVVIYISKSGSDDNIGLEAAYPVLTIDRALELAKQIYNPRNNKMVNFRVGEGDWGSITFNSLPYYLFITAYDGNLATSFSETLPHFATISAQSSIVALGSVVCDYVDANMGAVVYITEKYFRSSTIRGRHGGLCLFNGGATDPAMDIAARSNHDYVFLAYNFGYIAFGASRKVNVVENLTLSKSFMSVNTGSAISSNGAQFTAASGVKVTGKKYELSYGTSVALRSFDIDDLPGTVAGTKEKGAIISGIPYGGGAADEALMADRSWKPVLLQSGGEASNNLFVRKSNSPSYGLINDGFTLGTDPGSNRYWNLVFYDKNKKALGDVLCYHNADVYGGSSAIEFRLISDDGEEFDSTPTLGLIRTKSSNKTYAIAPTPLDSATGNEIVTAAWANKNISSKLSDYLPLAGGTLTGTLKVPENAISRSVSNGILRVFGGTSNTTGSSLLLFGKDNTTYKGRFILRAHNGTNQHDLDGRADTNALTWMGKNIVRSVNGTNADVNGNVAVPNVVTTEYVSNYDGYVIHGNGWIEQWGKFGYPSAIGSSYANPMTITFHKPMNTTEYHFVATAESGDSSLPCYATVVSRTTSTIKITVYAHNKVNWVNVYWRVVGTC